MTAGRPMPVSPDPCRVLYVGTLPPHPGGSAIVGAQLVRGLTRRGHLVHALAPITADALASGDRFADENPPVGIMRYLVPDFESAPNIPASDQRRQMEGKRLREHLHAIVARFRPDILVIGRETFAWHLPDFARQVGLPAVALLHGATTHGLLSGAFPPRMAEQLLAELRKPHCLIAVAHHLGQRYRQLGFSDVRVIQNGVDLQQFAPRPQSPSLLGELSIARDDVVVLHASNLKDIKRPFDIVRSARQTLPRDPRLVYVVVGDGPCRAAMEAQVRESGMAERFRFVGWVDHGVVSEYINLADLVVMPSETEALALVYLETLACGRVLLASDIPAVREVALDGETALLFRMGDVDQLSEKTLMAAENPNLRAAIGAGAREAMASFDVERTIDAYAVTLADVIGAHRKKPDDAPGPALSQAP